MPERACAACRHWSRTEFAGGWRVCRNPALNAEALHGEQIKTLPGFGCNQWAEKPNA